MATLVTNVQGVNTVSAETTMSLSHRFFAIGAQIDRLGMAMLRLGLVIVRSTQVRKYEADSIVPLVANSPVMHVFCHHPAPEYHAT